MSLPRYLIGVRSIAAVAALVAASALSAQDAQADAFSLGTSSNGAVYCYALDASGNIVPGSQPVEDSYCHSSFAYGVSQDGQQHCYPADDHGTVFIGREPVNPSLCEGSSPTAAVGNAPPVAVAPAPEPVPAPVAPMAPPPSPLLVKISSINDVLDPNHAREVFVHPGDVIRLTADTFNPAQGFMPMRAYAENFVWAANDNNGDICDVGTGAGCFGRSNFQATDYGVLFYVPYTISDSITISVSSHNPRAVDARGAPQLDQIVLRNVFFPRGWVAPTQVITSAEMYRYDRLDADLALAGHGHWVWIEGVRYFTPTTFVFNTRTAWEPYRHGYWAWDAVHGWTWISYDPWGWFTDHYGVWRYHGVYGWVWLPFNDLHYVPHAVSWFYSGEHIGWYPYFDGYGAAYIHGRRQGFIDGFEEGFRAAQFAGNANYHGGFTVIARANFTQVNVVNVIVNQTTIVNVTNVAVQQNVFSRYPGGSADGSRAFVANGLRGEIAVTHTAQFGPGNKLVSPIAPRPVPQAYTALMKSTTIDRGNPIGAARLVSADRPENISVVVPTTNGKAFVAPPYSMDSSGKRVFLPASTTNPTQADKQNPIYNRQKVPTAVQQPNQQKQLPAFQPNRPAPPAVKPQAVPTGTIPPAGSAPAQSQQPPAPAPQQQQRQQHGPTTPPATTKAPQTPPSGGASVQAKTPSAPAQPAPAPAPVSAPQTHQPAPIQNNPHAAPPASRSETPAPIHVTPPAHQQPVEPPFTPVGPQHNEARPQTSTPTIQHEQPVHHAQIPPAAPSENPALGHGLAPQHMGLPTNESAPGPGLGSPGGEGPNFGGGAGGGGLANPMGAPGPMGHGHVH